MNVKMNASLKFWTVTVIGILAAWPAAAAYTAGDNDGGDARRYGRVGVIEGGFFAQHPGEAEPALLVRNDPVYPGMYLSTEDACRASVDLADGSSIFLEADSALAVENLDISPAPETATLTLDHGSLVVQKDSSKSEILIYVSEGNVRLMKRGLYRVDIFERGDVRVAVFEGSAKVSSGAGVRYVDSGYSTYFSPFGDVQEPIALESKDDPILRWARSRGYANIYEYLPAYETAVSKYGMNPDTARYAMELDGHGTWRYHSVYDAYVWTPVGVAEGWRPYSDGYWCPTPDGAFWVSYEPWGWVTYHYGRWVWSADWGWMWLPGRRFAPAWVAWSNYGDHVGWCPLGMYDRPATTYWGFSLGLTYASGWTFAPSIYFYHWGMPMFSFSFGYVSSWYPYSTPYCGYGQVVTVVNNYYYGNGNGGGNGGGNGKGNGNGNGKGNGQGNGVGNGHGNGKPFDAPRRPRDWKPADGKWDSVSKERVAKMEKANPARPAHATVMSERAHQSMSGKPNRFKAMEENARNADVSPRNARGNSDHAGGAGNGRVAPREDLRPENVFGGRGRDRSNDDERATPWTRDDMLSGREGRGRYFEGIPSGGGGSPDGFPHRRLLPIHDGNFFEHRFGPGAPPQGPEIQPRGRGRFGRFLETLGEVVGEVAPAVVGEAVGGGGKGNGGGQGKGKGNSGGKGHGNKK